jgi:hypothetical protein
MTIKPTARCEHTVYRDGVAKGTITGWRAMTTKHGATGPGYFVNLNGAEPVGPFAYFADARRHVGHAIGDWA